MQSSDLLNPSYPLLDDLFTGKVACNVGDYILSFQNCALLIILRKTKIILNFDVFGLIQ